MNTFSHSLWMMYWIASTLTGNPAKPESDKTVKDEPPAAETVEVFQTVSLNHIDASDAVGVLRNLMKLPVKIMNLSDDRLVVCGSASDVRTMLEKYVPAIDVPGSSPASSAAAFLRFQHYPVHDLMDLVRTVAPKGRVGIDEVNQTLVINAGEPAVAAVRELLHQIDRPLQSVSMQFFFLRAAKPGADGKQPALPQALQPVAQTLAENGFSRPTLLAPIIVVAEEGSRFESRSVLHVETEGWNNELLNFEVAGSVRLQSSGGIAHLALEAKVAGLSRAWANDVEPAFELQTSLALKVGQYLVLSAAPSSTLAGDGVALVVRVVIPTP